MIESIAIRNLGVIEQAELDFGPGFTALTGETGAGKTMVLTALGLLLGGRADSGSVRTGANQLFVEGCWRQAAGKLTERLTELGAEIASDELLINRSVSTEGRSRAAVSGASVPISVLAELAGELVVVHGQSDQLRLRSASAQREALDSFGGEQLASALAAYQQTYRAWRETEARLERLRNASSADAVRAAELRAFLDDLERIKPEAGELQNAIERIERLSNIDSLRANATSAREALSGELGELDAYGLLGVARKQLEQSGDSELAQLALTLGEAAELVRDVSGQLASYLAKLELDPAQLEQLQQRRAELSGFSKKYGADLEVLIERAAQAHAELIDLDSGDEQIERLEQLFEAQLAQLGAAAASLTAARKQAAAGLAEQVSAELSALAMSGARFGVAVAQQEFDSHGADRIEFLLAPHAGSEPRALAKGASGGELSRVMLAIELTLAGSQAVPTMIFDEVDAGVGGAAAVELGRRLKQLSQSTQVIVVTHLPQVAAFADTQLRVSKDSSGGFTASSVERLDADARVAELARMLSGTPESEVAREHARELLAQS